MLAAVFAAQAKVASPPRPGRDDAHVVAAIMYGTLRYEALLLLREGGLRSLGTGWGWPPALITEACNTITSIIGAAPAAGISRDAWAHPPLAAVPSIFPHTTTLVCAALASGWLWPALIGALARLQHGFFTLNTRQFWCSDVSGNLTASSAPGTWSSVRFRAASEDDPEILLFFVGPVPICIEASIPLRPTSARTGARSRSNFLPEHIRPPLDSHGRPIWPKFRVTSLIENRDSWYKLLGNVDGVTSAIINGDLVYPRVTWLLRGSWLPNHPSFERPEVKLMLGLKPATYIMQGAVECLRTCDPPPLYVEPCGAVDKPGPDKFRFIGDSRKGNKGLHPWGTNLHNAIDFAALMDWCYWAFLDDVCDAYHLACFKGCRGGLVWGLGVIGIESDPDEPSRWRLVWGQRLHVGCGPGNCLRICDKAANGFCIDGCLMRWAVAHFGQATAGAPLNSLAMCLLRYMARRRPPHQRAHRARGLLPAPQGTPGVVWVDDFAFAGYVPPHPPCAGGEGGCSVCLRALPDAQADRAHFRDLCPRLGIGLHDDKSQDCTQRPVYAGFLHDTVLGRRLIPPKKEEKLVDSLVTFGCAATASGRSLDKVRGRARHYALCIPNLRVCCASLGQLLGGEEAIEYDFEIRISPCLRAMCQKMLDIIFKFAPTGAELWPTPPSTLHGRFLQGRAGPNTHLLTWDAATRGWAALARWWEDGPAGRRVLRELRLVGTWPAYASVGEQSHREGWGGALALTAFAQAKDLHSAEVLLRNDASAAISAFHKGSYKSLVLQEAAMAVNDLRSKLSMSTPLLHVPGLTLVDEGIDGASRDGNAFGEGANVEGILGPAVSDELWAKILGLADSVGWRPTVDLFASASNHRTDRFVSWFPEPDAEHFDAFGMDDWHASRCSLCQRWHRECFYAFPPSSLLKRFVEKAVADRAVGILVAPLAVTSPVWHKLLKASVLPGRDKYLRIRHAGRFVAHAGGLSSPELAIFPCDFGRLRGSPDGWRDPACAGAFRRRPRPPCGSAADEADRRLLRSALPS